MSSIVPIEVRDWHATVAPATASEALAALEAGSVLRLPLAFALRDAETALLSPALRSAARKNISYDPARDAIKGFDGDAALRALLREMLARYHAAARALVDQLFVPYREHLLDGRASFRPAEIKGRAPKSWRHDDTRLHVDAFPATPVQGRRLLRVFNNINPYGEPRCWQLGEPFAAVATRFAPRAPRPSALKARLLAWAKITKSTRSACDHYMLYLHDAMKADLSYQAQVGKTEVAFAPGETWIVYSDQVSHAVRSGRYMIEQTFYVPVTALHEPARAPLRVLEKLTGRALV